MSISVSKEMEFLGMPGCPGLSPPKLMLPMFGGGNDHAGNNEAGGENIETWYLWWPMINR